MAPSEATSGQVVDMRGKLDPVPNRIEIAGSLRSSQ
jgi:hypothetical protein